MNDEQPQAKPPQTEARPLLAFVNRHRLKLLGLLIALSLALMLADAVLKGSAY